MIRLQTRREFDHSQYYRDNREFINMRRRRKYHEDEEYREKIKKASRERWRESRKGIPPADLMVIKDRKGRKFYSIGKLAVAINRKVQTIRGYHRKGLLPDPLNFDQRGWRLYNENQVRMLADLFKRYDQGGITTDDLRLEIHDRWRE